MANIFGSEKVRKDYLDRYFTQKGVKALEGRLKTLTEMYIKGLKYPATFQMLSFPGVKIFSKVHHEGMIEELRQLLGYQYVEIKEKKHGNS